MVQPTGGPDPGVTGKDALQFGNGGFTAVASTTTGSTVTVHGSIPQGGDQLERLFAAIRHGATARGCGCHERSH